MSREAVDLSVISARVVENLRSAGPRREVSVEIQSPMRVQGDPRLLANVMENLIGNAWKYSANRARAEITVSLEATSEGEACVVRDNGVGFDMRDANRLFDAFHRAGSHEFVEGHGIGLATVRSIVELHGGKVWAVSSPGQGASFFFTLGSSDS
jgi:signal transduction histidine kinase